MEHLMVIVHHVSRQSIVGIVDDHQLPVVVGIWEAWSEFGIQMAGDETNRPSQNE